MLNLLLCFSFLGTFIVGMRQFLVELFQVLGYLDSLEELRFEILFMLFSLLFKKHFKLVHL